MLCRPAVRLRRTVVLRRFVYARVRAVRHAPLSEAMVRYIGHSAVVPCARSCPAPCLLLLLMSRFSRYGCAPRFSVFFLAQVWVHCAAATSVGRATARLVVFGISFSYILYRAWPRVLGHDTQ
jgi:hypothetical protein